MRTWSPHVALPLGSPLGPASPMRLQDDDTANASMFAAIPITPRARQPKRLGLGPPEGTPPEHAMQQQSPGLEQVAAHTPAAHQGPLVHQLASALKSPSCTFQRSASLRSHDGVAGEEALQTEVEVLRLDMQHEERENLEAAAVEGEPAKCKPAGGAQAEAAHLSELKRLDAYQDDDFVEVESFAQTPASQGLNAASSASGDAEPVTQPGGISEEQMRMRVALKGQPPRHKPIRTGLAVGSRLPSQQPR